MATEFLPSILLLAVTAHHLLLRTATCMSTIPTLITPAANLKTQTKQRTITTGVEYGQLNGHQTRSKCGIGPTVQFPQT